LRRINRRNVDFVKNCEKIYTDHAVLDAEAELVLGVGPFDLHLHDRGTGHGRQLHSCLVLRVLNTTRGGLGSDLHLNTTGGQDQGWAKLVLIALERYSVALKRLTFNLR
jgi:hypothetical protein